MFFSESSNMTSSLPRSTKKEKMKNYLSFGGGVNSVALHLYLLNEGWDFEAVFVDHGTDWPETYEYVEMFQEWLKKRNYRPITILKPKVKTIDGVVFDNLYNYYYYKKIFPFRQNRFCTDRFKITPLEKYQEPPCFVLLGIDYGEIGRATLTIRKGFEYRYPLIEARMNRDDCKMFIQDRNLPVPIKSGCYICPFQSQYQYRELRHLHIELFCKAEQLENRYVERRLGEGKKPLYICNKKPLRSVVEEDQYKLFEQDEYPPCNCML